MYKKYDYNYVRTTYYAECLVSVEHCFSISHMFYNVLIIAFAIKNELFKIIRRKCSSVGSSSLRSPQSRMAGHTSVLCSPRSVGKALFTFDHMQARLNGSRESLHYAVGIFQEEFFLFLPPTTFVDSKPHGEGGAESFYQGFDVPY